MSNHPLLSFRSQFLQGNPWQKFIKYTPTPWLTLLLVLVKSRANQRSCEATKVEEDMLVFSNFHIVANASEGGCGW